MHRNAQKLHPLNIEAVPRKRPHLSLQIESNAFHAGYIDALTKTNVRGIDVTNVDETTIIGIVQNVAEIYGEGWNNYDTMLRYWSGVVAGILTRRTVEVAE